MMVTQHEGNSLGRNDSGNEFAGKVAVITGGARGIGRAIAEVLGNAGATVVLIDFNEEAVQDTCKELSDRGINCLSRACDVRNRTQVKEVAESVWEQLGRTDYLVNNAGVYPETPLFDISEDEWDVVMDTNVKGVFFCTQEFARRMVANGIKGRVVNVSSTASYVTRCGISHYGASKAALNQLTRILALELANYGITVNAVCPGVIASDGYMEMLRRQAGVRSSHDAKLARIPLKRTGTPMEVAACVRFLLSDDASYITGSLLFVDGGYSLASG